MVHAIQMLTCKKGHTLPISFDNNNCGCHHEAKPCIMVTCSECLKNVIKNKDMDIEDVQITIPLDEDGMKVINELLK